MENFSQGFSYSAYVLGANFLYGFSAAARYEAARGRNWVLTPAVFYTWEKGLGFTAEAGLGFSHDSESEPVNTKVWRFGAAMDLDFRSSLEIPMGAAIFFRDEIPTKSDVKPSPLLGLGLYEMVHPSFNFGVEASKLITDSPTLSILFSLSAYY